ncbi:putative ribonuclease H-like domain-containing protein [Tanacetum coccineum]
MSSVPPPYTGNFIPFKPDLMFMDEIVKSENMDVTTIVTPRRKSLGPPVIEDWNFDDDSETMRVFNKRTRIVEETLNIRFLENAPNVTGNGHTRLLNVDSFDISTMNYVLIPKDSEEDAGVKPTELDESEALDKDGKDDQDMGSDAAGPSFTNDDPSSPVNATKASNTFEEHLFERFSPFKNSFTLLPVSNVTLMDDTRIFGNAYDDEDVGAEADLNNLETTMNISDEHAMVSYINKQRRTYHKDYQNCLFACFLSQKEPKKVFQAMEDPSWIEAMQEELLQFKLQKVWKLVDLPNGKRIEAIRLFLAYASFMGFIVYQMDVKSAFLYGTIEEEVYVCQPPGFEDPQYHDKVYKMSSIGELTFFLGLQVQQKEDGIFISQDKYVAKILKKFDFSTVKTASTPIETNKAFVKDEEAEFVDVHLYRSMIGSLMYLTASRHDILLCCFVCMERDSPFDLEAFFDSDYARASLDRKSTTGGYQFLGKRLISWQLLWIQNQMLDYGFNFMNTKIYIDNESTISIVKNLVFHSKTKHIEIRHHFIRDSYEKRLIQEGVTCRKGITTDASLVAAQDSDNIIRTQTTAMPNVDIHQGMDTCGSPRRQETMEGALAQTRSERVLEKPNEPPPREGHTSGSGEGKHENTFELAWGAEVQSLMNDLDERMHPKQGRKSDKKNLKFKDSDFEVLDDDNAKIVLKEDIKTAYQLLVSAVSAPVYNVLGVSIRTAEPRTPPTTAATAFIDEDLTIAQTLSISKNHRRVSRVGQAQKDKQKHQEELQMQALAEQFFDEIQARMDADHELALAVVPDEDETVDPEILSVKYPIVDWSLILYTFSVKLNEIFNRQDLIDLHTLVMKRFEDNTPEGYNLLLWGDLKLETVNEIGSSTSLLMDGTLTCFNMLVEKRYPLIKEMLKKMLNWKLEVEAESTMAFELLKFIKSHVEE